MKFAAIIVDNIYRLSVLSLIQATWSERHFNGQNLSAQQHLENFKNAFNSKDNSQEIKNFLRNNNNNQFYEFSSFHDQYCQLARG